MHSEWWPVSAARRLRTGFANVRGKDLYTQAVLHNCAIGRVPLYTTLLNSEVPIWLDRRQQDWLTIRDDQRMLILSHQRAVSLKQPAVVTILDACRFHRNKWL